MDTTKERFEEWKKHGAVDVELSEAEINDAFYSELAFGTGGLRGKLGQGTNRMNFQTVGRATFGLAEYLLKNHQAPSVAIAYDSRKFSAEFAKLSADILSFKGIHVYLFSAPTPTPVLSYTVRKLNINAGIVITASHNPKEYNGYKVYESHGCQITDGMAKEIIGEIGKQGYFNEYQVDDTLITLLGEEMIVDFTNEVLRYSMFADAKAYAPKIIYTPLHGTGKRPAELLFAQMGMKEVVFVEEQKDPDPNFSTCPYPNPEETAALELAFQYADQHNAELILATDPDADRLGVAERGANGSIRRFSGNEVGLILLNYILEQRQENQSLPANATIVKTVVSSSVGALIADKYGIKTIDVLTGFKYIGEQIDLLKSTTDFIFGFEESCGYLVGDYARDKDSICALMLVAEAKAYYKSKQKTLSDALNDIYKEHGYEATHLQSILFEGQNGATDKDKLIASVRANGIAEIAGKKISEFKDYQKGINGLPKSDVMEFSGDGFKFLIRPSGTEPKLKIYYFANGETDTVAQDHLKILVHAVKNEILKTKY